MLDTSALDRIKKRIVQDLALGMPPHATKEAFEADLHQRLDRLFSGEAKLAPLEIARVTDDPEPTERLPVRS